MITATTLGKTEQIELTLGTHLIVANENVRKFETTNHPQCDECKTMISYWSGKANGLSLALWVLRQNA